MIKENKSPSFLSRIAGACVGGLLGLIISPFSTLFIIGQASLKELIEKPASDGVLDDILWYSWYVFTNVILLITLPFFLLVNVPYNIGRGIELGVRGGFKEGLLTPIELFTFVNIDQNLDAAYSIKYNLEIALSKTLTMQNTFDLEKACVKAIGLINSALNRINRGEFIHHKNGQETSYLMQRATNLLSEFEIIYAKILLKRLNHELNSGEFRDEKIIRDEFEKVLTFIDNPDSYECAKLKDQTYFLLGKYYQYSEMYVEAEKYFKLINPENVSLKKNIEAALTYSQVSTCLKEFTPENIKQVEELLKKDILSTNEGVHLRGIISNKQKDLENKDNKERVKNEVRVKKSLWDSIINFFSSRINNNDEVNSKNPLLSSVQRGQVRT